MGLLTSKEAGLLLESERQAERLENFRRRADELNADEHLLTSACAGAAAAQEPPIQSPGRGPPRCGAQPRIHGAEP